MAATIERGRETRIPVSLRLPPRIVQTVDNYAAREHLSKTDAYVHFLERGLDSSSPDDSRERYNELMRQITEIHRAVIKPGDQLSFDTVKAEVNAAAQQYPAIQRVYLFGSFARGTQGPGSDIDLRLELDRSERFNLRDLEHFAKTIEQQTGRSLDVITAQVIKNESLAAAVEREKVLIYERKED